MSEETGTDYILGRYKDAIRYYWKASRYNKRAYKLTRMLVIVLGASVTLVASLASADFIAASPVWSTGFKIAAPVLAAILTIVSGFSQTFQWGAAWRDMVVNAERLERERDRLTVIAPDQIDPCREADVLNTLIIAETETFFQRLLGGSRKASQPSDGNQS
ncbi:MAG: DUF4231 domain-containing protein [Phycisphaerales bacterium]|nr:MAG: DUF4231 domain-containing protein [Phycisphaerales bacterium]